MSNFTQTNPTDNMIKRRRWLRWLVLILSTLFALALGWGFGFTVFSVLKFSTKIGGVLGAGLGVWIAFSVIEKSLVKNGAVQAFVTINPLRSLLGLGSPLVSYGPGIHVSYWWETRESINNVSLEAVAENFSATVQCSDGTLSMEGEIRLRPDIQRLPEFLSGVGTAANNLTGLLEAAAVTKMAGNDITTNLMGVRTLNEHLKNEFVHGSNQQKPDVSELEETYGIVIADATVNKLLPSKEIQETMGAISEARIIAGAVRDFICSTKGIKKEDYEEVVKAGVLVTAKEIDDTRDRLMAMSNNLQGMNLSRTQFDFNITGLADLPKDSLAALVTAAQSVAAMRGGIQQRRGNAPQQQKGSTK